MISEITQAISFMKVPSRVDIAATGCSKVPSSTDIRLVVVQ